eukprot:7339747-Ditylum_brightwellii.AAC.1
MVAIHFISYPIILLPDIYVGDDVSADCGDPDETRVAEPDNEELVIVPLATLKGHIYEDINGNGSQEEGESNLSE